MIVLLGVGAATSYQNIRSLRNNANWVVHTHEIDRRAVELTRTLTEVVVISPLNYWAWRLIGVWSGGEGGYGEWDRAGESGRGRGSPQAGEAPPDRFQRVARPPQLEGELLAASGSAHSEEFPHQASQIVRRGCH